MNVNKRVGRPRIYKDNTQDETTLGVINSPNNVGNHMELIYNDPKLFKKIIGIFKGYFVDDIFINFYKDKILILSTDNTKKTIIRVVIDCNKINEYYCKKEFEICIKREYLDKIFNTIEKQHTKIIFYSDIDSYLSTLYINLINDELSIHDNYVIDLYMHKSTDVFNLDHIVKDDYMIQFMIQSKIFKKFINDSLNNGKLLKIEKYGMDNLKFKMIINNKVHFTRTFVKEEKFKLKSKVKPNEYFNINLEIDCIKPFSNMNFSETINVFIDTDKKAIFEANIGDNMCSISVYTDIINLINLEHQ